MGYALNKIRKKEYLPLFGAYAIMPVGKEMILCSTRTQKDPGAGIPRAFCFRLIVTDRFDLAIGR